MLSPRGNSSCEDNAFGPFIRGCRDDFDFTLLFEYIFFSTVPSCVFIALSIIRIVYLFRKPSRVKLCMRQTGNLIMIMGYGGIQIAILIIRCQSSPYPRSTSIAAAALSVLASFLIGPLSYLEHTKALRPSILLNSYLLLSLALDVVQSRTLFLISTRSPIPRLFTAGMGVKIALLLLETQSKVKLMKLEDASRSPEEIIGPFSMSVLFWLNNLMMRGVRKLLLLEDLFPLDSSLAARHVHSIFWKKWESLSPSKGKSRLLWALWQTLKWAILTPIFPRLALIGFTFCQPFLINRIISYLQYSADHASKRVGYGLIGATAIVYVGIAISSVLYGYQNQRTITKLRACLVSAIFRQTTNLKSTSNDSNSVTLMSSDIERIQIGASVFHDLWANAIQVGLAAGLLRRELGTAFLVSLGTVLICGIASFLLGKLSGGRQALWMTALERRVSAITHIISNMKSLKMSGLSMHMNNHIQELREKELQAMSRARMLTTFSTVIGFTPLLITPVLTFAASSKNLDIGKIFTSLSFILLLTDPLTHLFQDIPLIIAAITCLDRVVAFLNSEPYRDGRHFGDLNDDTPLEIPKDSGKNSRQGTSSEDIEMLPMRHLEPEIHSPLVRIRNGYFGWEDGNKLVLRDINLDIPSSQLTMVVGPIGCGKTTLCKALLGEVPLMEGQTVFQERLTGVGFCDQTPYLPSKSIREIIIGDSEFDNSWYNEVIEVTALKPDLDTFPDGVSTIVGTRGTKLSGGQRQRLTIARALYARPSFAIFDDVLSGLDPSTLEHVFQKVFGPRGILQRQKATIVLCTHAIKYLGMADNVIQLGADGSIIHAGKFTDQGLSNQYFQSLQAQHLEKTLGSANIEEEIQTGFAGKSGAGIEKLDQGRQMGDVSIYRYYFSTIGIRALIPFFLFGISFGFTHNFSTVWLKFWSDENTRHPQSKSRYGYFLGIYSMIQLLDLLILGLYCQQNGSSLALKAGTRLHMKALRTLINAPMSYFSSTDIGITTNRFSQDMSIIDSQLAFGLSNTVLTGTTVIGQAAVLAIASPYIAVGYPLLLAILYGIQKFYLRTSRQLRFMDLETKSPLYTHFLETMDGLITLRAFNHINSVLDLHFSLLDTSQRPEYLLAMIQEWLKLVLSFVIAGIATLLVFLATYLHANAGFTGVGLIALMTFSDMMASLVRCWTGLETSISAVSRIKQFEEAVKSEEKENYRSIPNNWPTRGKIQMKDVNVTYEDRPYVGNDSQEDGRNGELYLALRNINLSIKAGEKIAIRGRTGSGKSTLLSVLLRLHDPISSSTCAPSLNIDSIPLLTLSPASIRAAIITVPQESFFLPSGCSFRANMDPLGQATREDCEGVLAALGLEELVRERGGLDGEMKGLSAGQSQVLGLARAVLRARVRRMAAKEGSSVESDVGGVLLLDEVSSKVDADTDALMQKVVREEFKGYTIVAVTHRLKTVSDFDRLIVMDYGSIKSNGELSDGLQTMV